MNDLYISTSQAIGHACPCECVHSIVPDQLIIVNEIPVSVVCTVKIKVAPKQGRGDIHFHTPSRFYSTVASPLLLFCCLLCTTDSSQLYLASSLSPCRLICLIQPSPRRARSCPQSPTRLHGMSISIARTHPAVISTDAFRLLLRYSIPSTPSPIVFLSSGPDPVIGSWQTTLAASDDEVIFGYGEVGGKVLVLLYLTERVG
jgi:hypothetical protein